MKVHITVNKGLSKKNAQRLWKNLYENIAHFPLQWDNLETFEIGGTVDEGFKARLYFTNLHGMSVNITGIHVSDTFDILQFGTSYGNLIY